MNDPSLVRERLRNVPNALSVLRIAAAPALLSDIADGWIARRFALQSPLGALLAVLPQWRANVRGLWWVLAGPK
jgi:phosphatidylglycerophosphate synthase